ncbi:MAG: HD domain-containing protein [Crocinitomicaceae bacterium]|nr:HD domain-containing protein [Crocinitomicaceae bacterium]MBK9591284.1 HD domain-containing protein [Crocinitomicaceae bacterium]
MDNSDVIDYVVSELKREFADESTGHDWFHIERVWKNAKQIAATEGGDLFVIELAALLHDIADHKFVEDADAEAKRRIQAMLTKAEVGQHTIDRVIDIVLKSSFKGGIGENPMTQLEGLIIQDADRLDAIGAIGIARTFAFGGKFGNLLYHPDIPPATFKNAEEYRKNRTHTINHFYEKLLLLKDRMNTPTGRKMAEQRHLFMQEFLNQFYNEWQGKI